MFWNKKNIVYDILIPPLDKPFSEFSYAEAKSFFDWYIDNIPHRIEYLQSFSKINLDLSVDSLETIWDWFLSNASIEKTPSPRLDKIKSQLINLPNEIAKSIIDENSIQFTLQTEYILRDIAMYFGEVCVQNSKTIYWGFHTDLAKDSFANKPLLMGFCDRDFTPPFKTSFDPEFTVHNIACNLFDGDADKADLRNMYNKWLRLM